LILISRRPNSAASYQCSSASRMLPSARRTHALPPSFRHLPGPYRFTIRESSRMRLPTAIVRCSRIGPTTSNRIARDWAKVPVPPKPREREKQRKNCGAPSFSMPQPPHPHISTQAASPRLRRNRRHSISPRPAQRIDRINLPSSSLWCRRKRIVAGVNGMVGNLRWERRASMPHCIPGRPANGSAESRGAPEGQSAIRQEDQHCQGEGRHPPPRKRHLRRSR